MRFTMQCVEIVSPLLKMDNHVVIIKLIFVLQPNPPSPWTLNRQIMYFHHVLYLSNVYFLSNIECITSLQYVFTCIRFDSKYSLEQLFHGHWVFLRNDGRNLISCGITTSSIAILQYLFFHHHSTAWYQLNAISHMCNNDVIAK